MSATVQTIYGTFFRVIDCMSARVIYINPDSILAIVCNHPTYFLCSKHNDKIQITEQDANTLLKHFMVEEIS